jgi:hypothetical protein
MAFDAFAVDSSKKKDGKEEKKKKRKKQVPKEIKDDELLDELDKMINNFEPLVKFDKYPYVHTKAIVTEFGDKGSGKTMIAFAFPGNVLAIGYEAEHNLTLPHEVYYSSTKRIQIKSFEKFLDTEDGEIKKSTHNMVYEATIQLLKNARSLGFDWIILDGLQRLPTIAEMRMRLSNSFSAYEGFKELTIWNERTDFLDQLYRVARTAARKGVIFTSQNVIQEAMFGPDKGKKKEPAWKGKIKEDTTTVIYTRKEETKKADGSNASEFKAFVDSCKLSGYSGDVITTLDGTSHPRDLVKKILGSKPKIVAE